MKTVVCADASLFDHPEVKMMSEALSIPLPLAVLLYSKGMDSIEKAKKYLYPDRSNSLLSPFLLTDMDKAVASILSSVNNGEKILIYGDYDVDGITSVTVLYRYLSGLGVQPLYYIPNRLSDGYGLNKESLLSFKEKDGVSLMITVDTGSTATEEIAYARSIGIETVVTDHHECHSLLPCCLAVVNPMRQDCTYPFKGLAGVGVVFKLITALEMSRRDLLKDKDEKTFVFQGAPDDIALCGESILERYGDLIALGTIADVMPLTEENRYIVKKGLQLLPDKGNPGIVALLSLFDRKKTSKEITASFISYTVAPKINAAGRMGDAGVALRLLLTDGEIDAIALAENLIFMNTARQEEESRIMRSAEKMISDPEIAQKPVYLLSADDWHMGVVGIVSARLTEKYHRPTILVSFSGEEGRGSARSIKGINLVDVLVKNKDLLVKFGGHEMAAGFSIERKNWNAFEKGVLEAVSNVCLNDEESELFVDLELNANHIDLQFVSSLKLLEPCGSANPEPLFLLRDAVIREVIPLSGGKYTKVILEKDGLSFTALSFDTVTCGFPFPVGGVADAVFHLSVNEFRGRKTVQLMLDQLIENGFIARRISEQITVFQEICNGKITVENPGREVFGAVYRKLSGCATFGCGCVSARYLCSVCDIPIPLSVFLMVCAVLREADLIDYSFSEKDAMLTGFELKHVQHKVQLDSSAIYRRLK